MIFRLFLYIYKCYLLISLSFQTADTVIIVSKSNGSDEYNGLVDVF